jgi:hypothetical protein
VVSLGFLDLKETTVSSGICLIEVLAIVYPTVGER